VRRGGAIATSYRSSLEQQQEAVGLVDLAPVVRDEQVAGITWRPMTISAAIESFVATGSHDPEFEAWEGPRARRRRLGDETLRRVLRRIVAWRADNAPLRPRDAPGDVAGVLRDRVTPMVEGVLGPVDASAVLQVLPSRVEVVTVAAFGRQSATVDLELAWTLANFLLDDLGAPTLADDAPRLDGFCEAGRAWVLPSAFDPPTLTTDVLAHEVAHLLHELTRSDVGLERVDLPIIPVPHSLRETYAYAAEVWACTSRALPHGSARRTQIANYLRERPVLHARVDQAALGRALTRAADDDGAGWAHILAATRPPDPRP
jgi:hypothetical protein